MGTYDVGQPVIVEGSFSVGGVPTNPTTVTFYWQRKPSGSVTTILQAALTNSEEGEWEAEVPTTGGAGAYWYRWVAAGAVEAVIEGSFEVRDQQVTP